MNKQIQNVVTEMIDGINYQQMIGGEIFLNLKDVAIGLGFERERERNGNITKTIRWDNIKKYLSEIDLPGAEAITSINVVTSGKNSDLNILL